MGDTLQRGHRTVRVPAHRDRPAQRPAGGHAAGLRGRAGSAGGAGGRGAAAARGASGQRRDPSRAVSVSSALERSATRVYVRLLGYVRPYAGRLLVAIACMVLYAVTSAVSLGMVVPLMGVLFERMAPGHVVTAPAAPLPHAAAGASATPVDRLSGWPDPLRRFAEGAFLKARPLVALER